MYGPKFVQSMVSQKTYDKYINWLNEGKRFDRFFIFMMIWPISPADFLCMLAGLTNMTFKRYMTIIILCKPITLVIYTYGLTYIIDYFCKRKSLSNLFLDHFPEIIDDIGQAIGVDNEGDRLAEDDDSHVAFEGHLRQTCQHTDEVSGTNGPDHHEDKEAIEPLAFIEPANVLVVGLLTDHRLDELRPVHSG